jgi:hypothetical protein
MSAENPGYGRFGLYKGQLGTFIGAKQMAKRVKGRWLSDGELLDMAALCHRTSKLSAGDGDLEKVCRHAERVLGGRIIASDPKTREIKTGRDLVDGAVEPPAGSP